MIPNEAGAGETGVARSGVWPIRGRDVSQVLERGSQPGASDGDWRVMVSSSCYYPSIDVLGVVMIVSADWLLRIIYGSHLSTAGCCYGHLGHLSV